MRTGRALPASSQLQAAFDNLFHCTYNDIMTPGYGTTRRLYSGKQPRQQLGGRHSAVPLLRKGWGGGEGRHLLASDVSRCRSLILSDSIKTPERGVNRPALQRQPTSRPLTRPTVPRRCVEIWYSHRLTALTSAC